MQDAVDWKLVQNCMVCDLDELTSDQLMLVRSYLRIEWKRVRHIRQSEPQTSESYAQLSYRIGVIATRLGEVKKTYKRRFDKMRHKVSDHALVRWLERVHGIDVDRLKDHIMNRGLIEAIQNHRNIIQDDKGLMYVVENGEVVTIMDKDERYYITEQGEEDDDFGKGSK